MRLFTSIREAAAKWAAHLSGEKYVVVITRNAEVFNRIRLRRGFEQGRQARIKADERLIWRGVRREQRALLVRRQWTAKVAYKGEEGWAEIPVEGWYLFGLLPVYKRIHAGDRHRFI